MQCWTKLKEERDKGRAGKGSKRGMIEEKKKEEEEEEEEDQTKHRLIMEMSREELALLLFLYVSFVFEQSTKPLNRRS